MSAFRARAGGYLREAPGGVNLEKYAVYAALLGGAWLAWKVIDKIRNPNKGTAYEGTGVVGTAAHIVDAATGGATSAMGSAIGGKLFEWFGPSAGGASVTYVATFPDGKRHAVDSGMHKLNAKTGEFLYNGKRYRLKTDSTGKRVAVAL